MAQPITPIRAANYHLADILISMHSSAAALIDDLQALGIRPGETILVHSSLRSLGQVSGGAETVIAGLREAIGDRGTLLMPALSYAYVHASQPLFSPRWTGTCVGLIPETFRRMPGVFRSVHPTHSVCAIGARARELTGDHHLDRTPVGPHSPFSRLPTVGGRILMLGCGLLPNTSMHGVEEKVEPPYLFARNPMTYVICADGKQDVVEHRRHGFSGFAQRYDRVAVHMGEAMVCGRVLESESYLLDSATLWRVAEALLREDPMYFVEPRRE